MSGTSTREVRRYNVTMRANPSTGGHTACMQERRSGMYVWFSDYDALRAENEALRKDAERYRWLESRISRTGLETRYYNGGLSSQDQRWYHVDYRNPVPESETLSEYIDSQIATLQRPQRGEGE